MRRQILFILILFLIPLGCFDKTPQSDESETAKPIALPKPEPPKAFTSYEIVHAQDGTSSYKIFGFDGEDEIGRFVYGDVNVFIERAALDDDPGNYAADATFYRSTKTSGKEAVFHVMMNPLRGRYSDWSSAGEFSFTVNNANEFDVKLRYSVTDGSGATLAATAVLKPSKKIIISVPVASLTAGGIDITKIKRLTFWLVDKEMPDIASVWFDDFTLTGTDPDAMLAAKKAAEDESFKQLEGISGKQIADYIPRVVDDAAVIDSVVSQFNTGPLQGVAKCDVVVVGGGLSGVSAAVAAARGGVDVILVEAYGFFGGMATAGLVFPFMNSRAGDEQIIKGIFLEIFERMEADGLAKRDRLEPGIIWFDKEELKYVLQEICVESGVKPMLHTWAEGPLQAEPKGQVKGVVVGNKTGRIAILADVVIDCTGDGDIAAGAGCPYEIGRGYDPYTQSVTLFFRMGNVELKNALSEQNKRLWESRDMIPMSYMFVDKIQQAKAAGDLDADIPINTIYFEKTLSPGVVSVNATRVFTVDPTKATDLTYAEIEARRQVHQLSRFMIKYLPGFADAFLQESAISLGVRESRRMLGEYQLTGHDVLSARKFDDVIARGSFGIDIHCADFSGCGVVGLELEEGASYDIPYGVLVPREVDGILVAGRCISATHVALGSVRIMPVVCATGQAAGCAASLCILDQVQPRNVPVYELQQMLRLQGANLGD